jgi:hypothetical protein
VVLLGKKWTFSRRWKDFNELHNILSHLFPIDLLPDFSPGQFSINLLQSRKEEIEARRARIEGYARKLLAVGEVRNSRIMQKFLKINKEYVPFL